MAGSAKLFTHLEPAVLKNLASFSSRDLSHVLYAYSVRNAGNPEIYKAFDARLEQLADSDELLDYPTLHDMLYYMMFRDNTSEKVWTYLINCTLENEETLPIVSYKPFKYSRFFL